MIKKIIIKFLKIFQIYFLITIGSLLIAISMNLFLIPNKIAPGGVSGLATVIYYLSDKKFQVGTVMLVLNIPLFIIGIKSIGKGFILRTIFGTIVLSLFIDISSDIVKKIFLKYFIDGDLMLHAVYGGLLMGVGLGLVFRAGATTGGTDMAAIMVNRLLRSFTVGQILLFIDTLVIISATIAFRSFTLALYALIALFVSSKAIDFVVEGVNFSKAVLIISDNWDEISNKILKDMDRGVTLLSGKGMYTGNDKMTLLCIVYRGQLHTLKKIVKQVDKESFVIVTDVREVLGEGFKNYEHIE